MKLRLDLYLLAFLLLSSILCVDSAYAYLDPGTGSMMIQLLLAGFAGASVGIRMYWRRLFKKPKREKITP